MSSIKKPSIDEHIERLQKEKTPKRDLWTGIEHSISECEVSKKKAPNSNRFTRTPMYAIAASLLVVMVVAYFSFQTGRLESSQDVIVQMSQQHKVQKEALLTSLEGQPTATQNWQTQLDELDDAADAIKKALENEPNNAALLKMLQRVYQQQIMLIERVHVPAWQQI